MLLAQAFTVLGLGNGILVWAALLRVHGFTWAWAEVGALSWLWSPPAGIMHFGFMWTFLLSFPRLPRVLCRTQAHS